MQRACRDGYGCRVPARRLGRDPVRPVAVRPVGPRVPAPRDLGTAGLPGPAAGTAPVRAATRGQPAAPGGGDGHGTRPRAGRLLSAAAGPGAGAGRAAAAARCGRGIRRRRAHFAACTTRPAAITSGSAAVSSPPPATACSPTRPRSATGGRAHRSRRSATGSRMCRYSRTRGPTSRSAIPGSAAARTCAQRPASAPTGSTCARASARQRTARRSPTAWCSAPAHRRPHTWWADCTASTCPIPRPSWSWSPSRLPIRTASATASRVGCAAMASLPST